MPQKISTRPYISWWNRADGANTYAADPLAAVTKPSPAKDRRHERRMLLPEEWTWLRTSTAAGSDRYGMTGQERMLLYAGAVQTGLRSNECRSLTRGRLFLDGEQPYIVCKARSTKNAKYCKQYIQRDLAAELVQHIATKAPMNGYGGNNRTS